METSYFNTIVVLKLLLLTTALGLINTAKLVKWLHLQNVSV